MIPCEQIVMSAAEQAKFTNLSLSGAPAITCSSSVRASSTVENEDLRVACARLDNWLNENAGRWVK